MRKLSWIVGLFVLATACAPNLTMRGARVRIASATSATECQAINDVDADGKSQADAEVILRNAAGEFNANTVVVSETTVNGNRVHLHGQAFGCRPVSP